MQALLQQSANVLVVSFLAAADPELLPALLTELHRMQMEQAEKEDLALDVGDTLSCAHNGGAMTA